MERLISIKLAYISSFLSNVKFCTIETKRAIEFHWVFNLHWVSSRSWSVRGADSFVARVCYMWVRSLATCPVSTMLALSFSPFSGFFVPPPQRTHRARDRQSKPAITVRLASVAPIVSFICTQWTLTNRKDLSVCNPITAFLRFPVHEVSKIQFLLAHKH